MTSAPNPGSREALEQGCKCPVLDNWHGSDELGRIRGFWISELCSVHAAEMHWKDRVPLAAEEGEN